MGCPWGMGHDAAGICAGYLNRGLENANEQATVVGMGLRVWRTLKGGSCEGV